MFLNFFISTGPQDNAKEFHFLLVYFFVEANLSGPERMKWNGPQSEKSGGPKIESGRPEWMKLGTIRRIEMITNLIDFE